MGVIRKTASISTLGMINFRSKKEKLQRAERALEAEHLARSVAESGFARVEGELKRLTKAEAKAAKQLTRLRRNRKVRKADRLTAILNAAQPMVKAAQPVVKDGMDTARSTMTDVAKQSRKHGKRAGKAASRAAERASHEVKRGAERAMTEARSAISS
ncbi:MAG: hypothetical protein QOJ00_2639 [Actinomycetota bacterium]|jgi:hypothetical protein